jgi:hypothetical protein
MVSNGLKASMGDLRTTCEANVTSSGYSLQLHGGHFDLSGAAFGSAAFATTWNISESHPRRQVISRRWRG